VLASLAGQTSLHAYVLPTDGSPALSLDNLPEEYRLPDYAGWGVLGELSRSEGTMPIVFFAQPHPLTGEAVSIAVGTQIRGERGVTGYLVIDIGRKLFEEKIGQLAKSGGALTELMLTDRSGCIIYDMSDARRDAAFREPESIPQKAFFISTRAVTNGISAIGMFPVSTVNSYASSITTTALAIATLSVILFLIMAIFMADSTARPIHMLTLTMQSVSQGRLDVSCPEFSGEKTNDELVLLIRQFNQMITRVNQLVENKVEQERNLRYAEVRALQAQMNPHFIYNTLNSIRSVAKRKRSILPMLKGK
jgi:two-component system sensor histidine kinase YesM